VLGDKLPKTLYFGGRMFQSISGLIQEPGVDISGRMANQSGITSDLLSPSSKPSRNSAHLLNVYQGGYSCFLSYRASASTELPPLPVFLLSHRLKSVQYVRLRIFFRRKAVPIVSLDAANDLAAQSDFWAIRGKAIHAYAGLEQGLARMFSALAGVNPKVGGMIFFRIGAAVRRNIIEELFRHKFKDDYKFFRNSLFKQLQPLDTERNQIVHWNVVNIVGADEKNQTTS
jgi:hypothetical protein